RRRRRPTGWPSGHRSSREAAPTAEGILAAQPQEVRMRVLFSYVVLAFAVTVVTAKDKKLEGKKHEDRTGAKAVPVASPLGQQADQPDKPLSPSRSLKGAYKFSIALPCCGIFPCLESMESM